MHKLEYYKNKFQDFNSMQGSVHWLQGRKFCFGGSELGTVLNHDKNQTFDSLIKKKFFEQNILKDETEWGKLFEPVAKIFIEKQKNIKIHEFGSIPHSYYPIAYSPDGLIVENEDLTLLEIKCPFTRQLKNIPECYLDQIQTGMNVISVQHTLFAQFKFRRCSLWTAPKSSYFDRKYHRDFQPLNGDKKPILYGFLYWKGTEDLKDLAMDPSILKNKPNFKPEIVIGKPFYPLTGTILMWKLFEVKYDTILPDKTFLSSKENLLWNKYKELRKFFQEEKHQNLKETKNKENKENLKEISLS